MATYQNLPTLSKSHGYTADADSSNKITPFQISCDFVEFLRTEAKVLGGRYIIIMLLYYLSCAGMLTMDKLIRLGCDNT